MGQIIFSDSIEWSEEQRQAQVQLMQVEGKLAVNLIQNLLRTVSKVENLEIYVIGSPDSVSALLLAYLNEYPSEK